MTWVQILALSIHIPFMSQPSGPIYSLYLPHGLLERLNKIVHQFLSTELQTPGHL